MAIISSESDRPELTVFSLPIFNSHFFHICRNMESIILATYLLTPRIRSCINKTFIGAAHFQ